MSTTHKRYRLLKTYEDPALKICVGVIKEAKEWLRLFLKLKLEDLDIKNDWFEPITEPPADTFLSYLIEQKEKKVSEHDFEVASQWRLVECLYRKYKEETGDSPGYVTIDEVVKKYIVKEKGEPPTPPKERIEGRVKILPGSTAWNKGKYYMALEVDGWVANEKIPAIKAAIEKIINQ